MLRRITTITLSATLVAPVAIVPIIATAQTNTCANPTMTIQSGTLNWGIETFVAVLHQGSHRSGRLDYQW